MDEHKICFIMCANQEFLVEECQLYLEQLEEPVGFVVEKEIVYGAKSMASGYNKAMMKSDAKYKVYLHQDVLLLHRGFLQDMVSIFTSHPEIGMLGVVGNKSIASDGCPWSDGMQRRIGELYSDLIDRKNCCIFSKIQGEFEDAVVLDGLLMATQYDLPWREDLFQGWDFYDCSQSLEFWKAGYRVVVPHMESPWCLHDNDILNQEHYEKWWAVFEKEYGIYYKNWEKWKGKKVAGKGIKNVIYQKFNKNKTLLHYPYPPVYQEQDVDYICFAEDRNITSSFWEMRYVGKLEALDIQEQLSGYMGQFELFTDQIQVGAVFSGENAKDAIVTVPSFQEIPGTHFKEEEITPTADNKGNYIYKKNPEYINGKYQGRPLLLTIGVPVSNQIDTIDMCLSHVRPLLDELDAELVVIDTGSTDGTIEVCKSYGARIFQFPWCDNMSAVRNEAMYHARGEWYLSIDDDEWFEDVEDILGFFQSGMYRKCDTATYIQRNYQVKSGKLYNDNHTLRMARITPELHFEGRIHDSMIVPKKARNCQLFSYSHHYGFITDDREKARKKYIRNATILLYDLKEYPNNLRYNFHLANELKCEALYKQAIAYFFRGISIEREMNDEFFGKLHVVSLLSSMHESMDKQTFTYTNLLCKGISLSAAEKAFLSYNQAELALIFRLPADEILKYCKQYKRYRKMYEKNPYNSQIHTFYGLQACINESYITDANVLVFCAYIQNKEWKKALKELERISFENIFDKHRAFFEHAMLAEEPVLQIVMKRLTPGQWEEWREELLDAFFVSICHDDVCERQLERLPGILKNFSVQGIEDYMKRFYQQLTEKMQERLYQYSLNCNLSDCPLQELFLCGYVLKEQYAKAGKKERDMGLFMQYVKVNGAFASRYYHPALLGDLDCHAIPADLRAAYAIYLVLQDGRRSRQNIQNLKKALELFPGFKSEIQYLLEELAEAEAASPQEEIAALAQSLKKQIAALLENGRYKEAKPMLQELSSYFPQDQEIQEMLERVE